MEGMLMDLDRLEKRLAKSKNQLDKAELEPIIYELAFDFLERTIEKKKGSDYEVTIKVEDEEKIYEISQEKLNSLTNITTASRVQLISSYKEICEEYDIKPSREIVLARDIKLLIKNSNMPDDYHRYPTTLSSPVKMIITEKT